jgi:EAL domain-containing protein (putative c-di-GMP-specific phosphodiesterase class I)
VGDGKVVGAEALVRWNHPLHGFVSPEEFIPLAETTGGIHALTSFVLREALHECRRWHDRGHPIGVAVNLAVRNLRDGALPDEISALLAESGVPARHLTLEITESSIMRDTKRSTRILDELAALGVELAVDDFGTGYSSLSYLQQLPVHEIKIDKSFVLSLATNPNDATIVRSIIELGHNLNLGVVAEGVENGPTWDRLRAMQCDTLQGFFLARPMPADKLADWLDGRRGRSLPVGSRRFVRENADPIEEITPVR